MRKILLFIFMLAAVAACSSPPPAPEVDDPAASPADILGQGEFCCPFYEPSADAWHYCCAPGTLYEAAYACMQELQADGHVVNPPDPTPAEACSYGPPPVLDTAPQVDPAPYDVFDPPGEEDTIVVIYGAPDVYPDKERWWTCAEVLEGGSTKHERNFFTDKAPEGVYQTKHQDTWGSSPGKSCDPKFLYVECSLMKIVTLP